MPDIRYIVVHPDASVEAREGPLSVSEVQGLVGGPFEALTPPVDHVMVLANENGKGEGLAYNWLATAWMRRTLHPNDNIVGDLVVAGVTSDGDATHVPDAVVETIEAMRPRL
jgi:Domain of unknown function (DUF3846)